MKDGSDTNRTTIAASSGCTDACASARTETGETPYVPLDINDPDGRFGNWMPGDDPDDWR